MPTGYELTIESRGGAPWQRHVYGAWLWTLTLNSRLLGSEPAVSFEDALVAGVAYSLLSEVRQRMLQTQTRP